MRDTIVRMTRDHLSEYLDALQREDCYRVDAVLKESAYETTQRVFLVDADGAEQGPFIRKFISRQAGMGAAYALLYEAQRAGRCFRYLPDVIECYATQDCLAVVMEHVSGATLQDVVMRCGPSLRLAEDVFPHLCEAASELHECFSSPIIHRDFKPTNVILSGSALTVIDFGIAREYKQGVQADTTHFGTRSYAPPEQFGFGQTTVRSDVYALGMVLWFCLTGQTPDEHARQEGFKHRNVPEFVRQVIVRATDLNPERRYAGAAEMRAAFLRATRGFDAARVFRDGTAGLKNAWRARAEQRELAASRRKRKPARESPFAKLPLPVCKAWNACLLLALLFYALLCVMSVVNPNEFDATLPLWYLILIYGGVAFPVVAWPIYMLMDKRRLKERFPLLARMGFKQEILCGFVLAFVLIFLMTCVMLAVPEIAAAYGQA